MNGEWSYSGDDMHKHYIINSRVAFDPAAGTLHDINNPDRAVALHSPASRCLLLLIERAGSIVTQQECMDIVWQSRGMLVSANTFYQNISILRKGLKKTGLESDPVVTIPRIGVTLASDTKIIVRGTPPSAAEETEPLAVSEDAPTGNAALRVLWPAPGRRRYWLAGALIAAVVVVSQSFIRDNHFIDDYQFAEMAGECRVYLATDIQSRSDRATALTYAAPFRDDCEDRPWVYISWYAMLPRASVIRCDRPMTEPNRCMSDYFIEDR